MTMDRGFLIPPTFIRAKAGDKPGHNGVLWWMSELLCSHRPALGERNGPTEIFTCTTWPDTTAGGSALQTATGSTAEGATGSRRRGEDYGMEGLRGKDYGDEIWGGLWGIRLWERDYGG